MKFILRVLGVLAAACGVLLLVTLTFAAVKKVWLKKDGSRDHIAVVDLTGMILRSSVFLHDLQEARENDSVKAIVLRVNSPGGLVAPSQEMYQAIRSTDQKKPVIVSMGAVGASGAYYAALGARKIYANPGTITASIGVILELMNTEKLYKWAKVDRFALKSGKFKDVGSPFRDMTPEDKALLQNFITDVYQEFRAVVKERRKVTDAELDATADGRIMSGNQAKQAKLIDLVGGIDDAIQAAKEIGGLPNSSKVAYPEGKGGLLRDLLLGDSGEGDDSITRLLNLISQSDLISANPLNAGYRVLLLSPIAP
jgi:protease IV